MSVYNGVIMSTDKETKKGYVFYTDGSTVGHDKGYSGFGLFGYEYEYSDKAGVKSHASNLITNRGFFYKDLFQDKSFPKKQGLVKVDPDEKNTINLVSKDGMVKTVNPLNFIECNVTLGSQITNNEAEVYGLLEALLIASKKDDIKEVVIKSDSQYAVLGAKEYVLTWKQNGWTKRDGTTISNPDLWKKVDSYQDLLSKKGVQVDYAWVRGHNNNYGNSIADALANIGSSRARDMAAFSITSVIPAKEFLSPVIELHPFFMHRHMYFSLKEVRPTEEGVGHEYFVGVHDSKEVDQIGKKISDKPFSYLRLSKPQEILESLKTMVKQDSFIEFGVERTGICYVDLNKFFTRPILHSYENNGKYAFWKNNKKRLNYFHADKVTLVIGEVYPVGISTRELDCYSSLSEVLDHSLGINQGYEMTATDITDQIYEIKEVTKKGQEPKLVKSILPTIKVGHSHHDIVVKHTIDGNEVTVPVRLVSRIDIPDRNLLKSIESFDPKISLLVWTESLKCVRYALSITLNNGDMSVWSGFYSNYIYLT